MKKMILGTLIALYATVGIAVADETALVERVYGLHLFFNEREFVDVLTLRESELGLVSGHMFVPDDFAGEIENLLSFGGGISFDLLVPKNASRPEDMYFQYSGRFFDLGRRQITGFVTLRGTNEFIASFVAFLRE